VLVKIQTLPGKAKAAQKRVCIRPYRKLLIQLQKRIQKAGLSIAAILLNKSENAICVVDYDQMAKLLVLANLKLLLRLLM